MMQYLTGGSKYRFPFSRSMPLYYFTFRNLIQDNIKKKKMQVVIDENDFLRFIYTSAKF